MCQESSERASRLISVSPQTDNSCGPLAIQGESEGREGVGPRQDRGGEEAVRGESGIGQFT